MSHLDEHQADNVDQYGLVPSDASPLQTIPDARLVPDDSVDLGNLDKIRDILFGHEVRSTDQRFSRLEERLVQECKILREDLTQRLDSLDGYLQREIQALNEQIKSNKSGHAEAIEQLTNEHNSTTQALDRKLSQLDERTIESERILRKQLLDQSNELNSELRIKYDDLLAIVEREVQILHTVDQSDRTTLATFFGEMAVRLKAD